MIIRNSMVFFQEQPKLFRFGFKFGLEYSEEPDFYWFIIRLIWVDVGLILKIRRKIL